MLLGNSWGLGEMSLEIVVETLAHVALRLVVAND